MREDRLIGGVRDIRKPGAGQDKLVARLRHEAELREDDLRRLRKQLDAAVLELEDLRAIRDALTPPELPSRPGLDIAAAFLPATAEQVSGDFYLVAEGPQGATVVVVGDVIGHGLQAAQRAAFVRTAFAAVAPFSDDPSRLLTWAHIALIERIGTSADFVTAACATYHPGTQLLRWAYAGHPPGLWLDDGTPLAVPEQGTPLGVEEGLGCVEGSRTVTAREGFLLYTDGLTEARRGTEMFGVEAVSAALTELRAPLASEAISIVRARVAEFAYGGLTDDLCLLAVRFAESRRDAKPARSSIGSGTVRL